MRKISSGSIDNKKYSDQGMIRNHRNTVTNIQVMASIQGRKEIGSGERWKGSTTGLPAGFKLRVIVNDEGFLYMKFFGSSDDKLKS